MDKHMSAYAENKRLKLDLEACQEKLQDITAQFDQLKLKYNIDMDKIIKNKIGELMQKGMRISGLEATVRQLTTDKETTEQLLKEARLTEDQLRLTLQKMDLEITELRTSASDLSFSSGVSRVVTRADKDTD
jgi:molecular chaperone GrpE (heat shock protein)